MKQLVITTDCSHNNKNTLIVLSSTSHMQWTTLRRTSSKNNYETITPMVLQMRPDNHKTIIGLTE